MLDKQIVENRLKQITENIMDKTPGRMNSMLSPEIGKYDMETMSTVIGFKAREWERNQRGELHGGAVAAMFDTAMGITASGVSGRDVTTADLSVSYIRPFVGESFVFRTEVIHPGRTLIRLSCKAHDEETGKCLASATANFAYMKR